MRAFVAGATGYTGRHVVGELLVSGIDVVAHVRPGSPSAAGRERMQALGATVDATPWDAAAMEATLARLRPDLVFALLGTTRARGRAAGEAGREETYETVDYGLTVLLLRATRTSAPDARFIYLSALGVGASEPRNDYLRARWRVEAELSESGLDFLIVRPSFISGPDREERRTGERVAARVLDAAVGGLALVGARRARDRYASVTGAELARMLVAAALQVDGPRVLDMSDLRRRMD